MKVDPNLANEFVVVSIVAVAIVFSDAKMHHILFPSQMMAHYGRAGINAITHLGLWSDLLFLPFVMRFMLLHSGEWSVENDWWAVVLGVGIAAANQVLLNHSTRPDPLGFTELTWSTGIAVHAVYMATYIAIIAHFYWNPVDVSVDDIVILSVCLALHVAAGTHVFLGLAQLVGRWDWCPDPLFDGLLPYMNGVIWALLTLLAWFASGKHISAPIGVASYGALFGAMVLAFTAFK